MRFFLTLLFLLLGAFYSKAQINTKLSGSIIESNSRNTLPGATILIASSSDTLQQTGTTTNAHGNFNIDIKPGNYAVTFSFIGYQSQKKNIHINGTPLNLGTITLNKNSELMEEISIKGERPPTIQKGDTTLYHANAYRVNLDANVGELIAKMPGFYEIDGKMMAQGKEIAEVLIDGKQYFGEDISQALNLLPHDVVESIEVYAYKSDEAKFSGFDDPEEKNVVNIVTKNKGKALLFGELAGGVGKSVRYGLDGNFNLLGEKKRLMVSANSRNVEAPLSLRGYRHGGNFISGDEVQSNSANINFNTNSKHSNLSLGYGISDRNSNLSNKSTRAYTSEELQGQVYTKESNSENESNSNRFNVRWSLKGNKKHNLMVHSSAALSSSNRSSLSESATTLYDEKMNSNSTHNSSNGTTLNLNQELNYAYRFNKKGRSISFHSSYSTNKRDNDGNQHSTTLNSDNEINQLIDLQSHNSSLNKNLRAGVSYSDKIGKKSQINLGFTLNNNISYSQKNSFSKDSLTSSYNLLDTLTSNEFKNETRNKNLRLSYRFNSKNHNLTLASDVGIVTLKSVELFPDNITLEKDYFTISPSIRYNIKTSQFSNFNINYNNSKQNPSLNDLQEIINVSNPLFISNGNAHLKRSSNHSIRAGFRISNHKKGQFLSISIDGSTTKNSIGRKTFVATSDTLVFDEYLLPAGGQFSQPVNMSGQYRLSTNLSGGMQLLNKKLRLNSNTSGSVSQLPTFINNHESFTHSWSLRQNINLSTNINEKIDISFVSSSGYRTSTNQSSISAKNNTFISQSTTINMYWNFYKGFIFKIDGSNNYQNSFSTKIEEMRWHLNFSLSTKLFKNKRGELAFTAFDMINNNDVRNHNITETYTEDSYRNKLSQFYMLSFSYKLRNSNSIAKNIMF